MYRLAYRVAWGIRRAVKPLTTQAFRHKVRHALLRKAYFDDSYATPPLVAAGARGALVEPEIKYPAHVRPRSGEEREGVNVVGYLAAESGIGESARAMLRILKAAGTPVAPINFRVGNLSRMHESIPGVAATEDLHAVNLFHINADQMPIARAQPRRCRSSRDVTTSASGRGSCPSSPTHWLPSFDLVDEVWVPSSFCQRAIAAKSPVPVLCVPHSVAAPSPAPDRERFALAPDDVAFFAMCDVLSVPERKNPLGVVEAFRAAFPASEPVRLFLKIGNLEFQPDLKARLAESSRARIRASRSSKAISRARTCGR